MRVTTAALSDVADTILNQVVELVEPGVRRSLACRRLPGEPRPQGRWVARRPRPVRHPPPLRAGFARMCAPTSLLGLGKLGGPRDQLPQRPRSAAHLRSEDGTTDTRRRRISLYFTELAQRVDQAPRAQMGPMGRLYEVDMRLRPTGKSGSASFYRSSEFKPLLRRIGVSVVGAAMALSRARVVSRHHHFRGSPPRWKSPPRPPPVVRRRGDVHDPRRDARVATWCPAVGRRSARHAARSSKSTAGPRSLKRGPGRADGRGVRGAVAPTQVRPRASPRCS